MALLPELLEEKPLLLALVPVSLTSPALPGAQDPLTLIPGLAEAKLEPPLPPQDVGVPELAAASDPLAPVPGALELRHHGNLPVLDVRKGQDINSYRTHEIELVHGRGLAPTRLENEIISTKKIKSSRLALAFR